MRYRTAIRKQSKKFGTDPVVQTLVSGEAIKVHRNAQVSQIDRYIWKIKGSGHINIMPF
jgi:hypothetical protein